MGLAARLSPAEREALELLAKELKAERFPTANEIIAEAHGAPALVTEIVCRNCGHLLIRNQANFMVHLESTGCSRPVFDIAEVTR